MHKHTVTWPFEPVCCIQARHTPSRFTRSQLLQTNNGIQPISTTKHQYLHLVTWQPIPSWSWGSPAYNWMCPLGQAHVSYGQTNLFLTYRSQSKLAPFFFWFWVNDCVLIFFLKWKLMPVRYLSRYLSYAHLMFCLNGSLVKSDYIQISYVQ